MEVIGFNNPISHFQYGVHRSIAGSPQQPQGALSSESDLDMDTADTMDSDQERNERLESRIKQLEKMDHEVREHEQAHKSVGGAYAGEITYRYITGPDGKRYAVGGSTPISAPRGRTPEETIQIMQKVRRAAMAPCDPSPADIAAASKALSMEIEAVKEIRHKSVEKRKEISEKLLVKTGFKEKPELEITVSEDGRVKVEYHKTAANDNKSDEKQTDEKRIRKADAAYRQASLAHARANQDHNVRNITG